MKIEYHSFKINQALFCYNGKGIWVRLGALLLAVDRLTGSYRLPPTFITGKYYKEVIKSQQLNGERGRTFTFISRHPNSRSRRAGYVVTTEYVPTYPYVFI